MNRRALTQVIEPISEVGVVVVTLVILDALLEPGG